MKPSIGRIVIYHHPGSADGKYPPQDSPAIGGVLIWLAALLLPIVLLMDCESAYGLKLTPTVNRMVSVAVTGSAFDITNDSRIFYFTVSGVESGFRLFSDNFQSAKGSYGCTQTNGDEEPIWHGLWTSGLLPITALILGFAIAIYGYLTLSLGNNRTGLAGWLVCLRSGFLVALGIAGVLPFCYWNYTR
jgi:hypothetical protein